MQTTIKLIILILVLHLWFHLFWTNEFISNFIDLVW